MLKRVKFALCVGAASLPTLVASAQQESPVETVLSTLDNSGFVPASGSLDGTQTWLKRYNSAFQSIAPTIHGNGNVSFTAVMTAGVGGVVGGPFSSGVGYNQFTVWSGGPGALTLEARYGDPTLDNANCGGAGAVFTSRATQTIPTSPSGYMYIGGYQIAGGTVTSVDANVMWVGQSGAFHNFVRGNDLFLNIPDLTNAITLHQDSLPTSPQNSFRLNNLGQAAYLGKVKASVGNGNAFNDYFVGVAGPGPDAIAGQNGRVVKVVRVKDDLLGTGSQVTNYGDSAFNHAGRVFNMYGLAVDVGGVTASDNQLVVMSTPTGGGYTHAILARSNGATGVGAIEYASGSGFGAVARQSLNNSGRAIWLASLKQGVGGITSDNDTALMTHKDGMVSIVVQKGPASAISPALPGNLALGTVGSAGYNIALSNSDQVAWVGTLAGTGINVLNDQFLAVSTIASDGSVTHRLVLREGEQVPDAAPGLLWGGHSQSQYPGPGNVGINASGIVIFQSYLQGTGITDNVNDWSTWAFYPSCGTTRKVSATGMSMGGVTVQYTAWNTNPNGEGSSIGFNDEGWLAFLAYDGGSPTNPPPGPYGDGAIMRVHFCPADLDDGGGAGQPDGGIDINDLLYFLGQYESGVCGADLDGGAGNGLPDGGVDINDLLFFLAHYEGGC